MKSFRSIVLFGLLAVLACSCSNTRRIADSDSLFLGSKVVITDNEQPKDERSVLRDDLTKAVRPRPNSNVLGIRFKLSIYNLGGDPKKEKGLRRAIRKAGEPPVLTSTFDTKRNVDIFTNVMNNRGYFYPKVEVALNTKKKKTRAVFTVTTGPQYRINDVFYIIDSSQASKDIFALREESLLKKDAPYNLDLIKGERERIDRALKEKGYYYFKPDYMLVRADTGVGDHKVNLFVVLKQGEIPEEVYKVYTIHQVYIYPNFKLNSKKADTSRKNAEFYEGYHVIDKNKNYKPQVFTQSMQFKPGEIYNRTDQNVSLNRLIGIGAFKFVKNRFDPVDTIGSFLDAYYFLTPYPKKSIRFEIGGLTQNDSRAGSQASISFRNRNTFHGAEIFELKLNGGFEAQYSGAVQQPNTYQYGIQANLIFPRFSVPFATIKNSSYFVPHTFLRAGYSVETRNKLFRIYSTSASYGFEWKEDLRKEHAFYPINVTYVRTDTLGNTDNLNLNFSNLVFNGLIVGPTYEFTYNSQGGAVRRHNFYFNGLIDISGALNGIGKRATYGDPPGNIFGVGYAKYIKVSNDYRYYFNFTKHQTLAARLYGGVGIPYGNSYQLPNIKQFFSGGNSSLRGFRSRLVGPGTYNELALTGKQTYIELLGDVKAEFNLELRTDIYQFLKAAVFYDAGNVWLYNDNPNFPGGKFTSSFLKELAADAGVGLRFDFSILLLRLDLGIPVRKPWLPEGDRWVLNQIDFGERTWRRDNLILNIAIGYPF